VIRRFAIRALVLTVLAVAPSTAQTPAPQDAPAIGRELDAIRDQLVTLDIESALAALRAILERPGLSDADRVAALDLRAQAYAASDDLAAVETDFRAILELNAGYAPDRGVTSKKALARFAKIQAGMIGTIQLSLDPKDAALTVDDRPVAVSEGGTFPAVAGERRLRFSKRGFDALDTTVHAVAGQETLVKIQLIPNARTLVVRTDIDGVSVAVDGTPAGLTARAGGSGSNPDAPAELHIESLPIGEHEIRLTKSCYAAEVSEELVSADLADRSAKVLGVVAMRPARTRVTATGGAYDGELRVDGERVAPLPLTSFSMCPGARRIEVVASGRVVWSGEILAEESDITLDLAPRPSVVLVGTRWPAALLAAAAGWSLRETLPVPPGVDLATREGWSAVAVPPGTDLVVAVIPSSGIVGDDRVVFYSPALQEVEDRPSPAAAVRPSWRRATIGAVFVDDVSGGVVTASIAPSGPAAKAGLIPGDRLVAIAGRAAATAAAANEALDKAGAQAKLALELAAPGAAPRKIECVTSAEPRPTPSKDDASRALRAAWASVEIAAGGPDAAVALATLANLLERAGRDAAALDAWKRVRQSGDEEFLARAAYAVGMGQEAAGKRPEAIEAFTQARSEASARGDRALAAAAGDRLADLGVAER
jgi:hypothetical protein